MIDIDQPGPSCRQFLSTETSAFCNSGRHCYTITSAMKKSPTNFIS
ncbi:unnamed protein product [Ceutorhynchus assimilis]|uniref:Uncharacterized protein n=1 Tax=Ceutorhynchus assimilis TaxID=467358 RepID=A0A9N9QM98_9CUCU|nr:unnamed protein product [Ceutorhynchus assimilis]